MDLKEVLKKFWFIVWKDDSLKGWIFSILFLFIVIKFIFFPVLSFATGTILPLAIVESCSMYHEGNLLSNNDEWWDRHSQKYDKFEIEKQEFDEFKFRDGLNKGDILFVIRANPKKLKVGDTIIFTGGQKYPVIHRIINIKQENGEYVFSTIGDNNDQQFSFETNIRESHLIGKPILKPAPYFGWIKLIFFEFKQPESKKGFCEERR
jgi:signal peptidase I